jgi:alpha-galactosidase
MMKHAAALPVVLFCLSLGACARSDLSGVWLLRSPNSDGTTRDEYLDLKQSGSTLTGTLIRDYRKIEISDGTVNGSKFHFVTGRNGHQMSFDGTLAGDHLTVAQKSSNGRFEANGEARRSTAEEMAPPKPLPVPALYDVPYNGLAKTPPMGWNSWNHFAGKIDDATVRQIADAMATNGMKAAGYIYVNIDDTWQLGRDADGNITANKKFPDMKALADYVHSKGLKIGLYSGPGPKTCAGYEGSFGHEEADAKMYAKWGFDYLKYDWCSAGAIYKDSDMQAVYQKMGDALRSTGRPIVFSLCQYGRADVWSWGAKVDGNLWRTTGDISDNWDSMSKIAFKQLAIAQFAKPGHWNDPDMLEVGNGGMTDEEYRTHMALWAMLRAPLLAGNDVRNMSEATKAILLNRDIIAIDQDPLGKPAELAKTDGDVEIWTRPLDHHATALAFFNKGEQPATVKVSWHDLKLRAPARARDLWAGKNASVSGSGYTAKVPGHGSVVLRLQ